jgi:hypothetical protein
MSFDRHCHPERSEGTKPQIFLGLFYEPVVRLSIERLLRRTLVRSVILFGIHRRFIP